MTKKNKNLDTISNFKEHCRIFSIRIYSRVSNASRLLQASKIMFPCLLYGKEEGKMKNNTMTTATLNLNRVAWHHIWCWCNSREKSSNFQDKISSLKWICSLQLQHDTIELWTRMCWKCRHSGASLLLLRGLCSLMCWDVLYHYEETFSVVTWAYQNTILQ